MAAAPPPCSTPAAWVDLGPALPPQTPPVRRRHAQELRAPHGHRPRPPAGPWRTGCGRKGTSTATSRGAGGRGPGRDRPGEGLRPDGIEEDEEAQRVPVGRLDQRLPVGRDREEVPGTGERAQAAGQQQRVSGDGEAVPPGTGRGTGSGGSTRSPWPPKPPKAPRAEPQPPVPNGPMVVTTPAPPPLATTSKSPSRPRASPVRCS